MSAKKLSGAQRRKRDRDFDLEATKSSVLMTNFLKRNKPTIEETAALISPTKSKEEGNYEDEEKSELVEQQNLVDNKNDDLENDENIIADVELTDSKILKSFDGENTNNNNDDHQDGNAQGNNIAQNPIPAVLEFHDVGYIDFNSTSQLATIPDKLRTDMLSRSSQFFQNKDSPFALKDGRSMTRGWFSRRLANGDEVNRSWLLYSPRNEAAYCFCCLMYTSSTPNSRSSFESASGFSNWRHTERVHDHENSPSHRKAFTTWKEAERRLYQGKGIDSEVQLQIQSEKQRWRDILKRVLDCIRFLASQNFAFRGHTESLHDDNGTNNGNFLALLKLISLYDPLMASHLKHVKENPRSVSYLSPEIQNEFISLLANRLRNQLLIDIRRNRYYGILLDSTPDLGHREQLSEVIRFVDVDFVNKTVAIKESFLGFIEIHAKDAATLERVIVERLENDNLSLTDCRSQCYDNAAVMTGHISGLQQRITARNHRALFVNCDNHSLNLAGVHSAKQDPIVITFFGTIQAIYVFFSRSTLRWEELKKTLPITVKRESETRWSARAEAVRAVHEGLHELLNLLEKLANDRQQTADTRADANDLLQNLLNFNFIALLYFWNTILGRIDRVQKRLQDPTMHFKDAASDLEGLENKLQEIREDVCARAVEDAKGKCATWGIDVKRIRRRRMMPGELARDAGLTAEEEVVRVMKSTIDRLQQEMNTRFTRLKDLNSKFGFLLDIPNLMRIDNQHIHC